MPKGSAKQIEEDKKKILEELTLSIDVMIQIVF